MSRLKAEKEQAQNKARNRNKIEKLLKQREDLQAKLVNHGCLGKKKRHRIQQQIQKLDQKIEEIRCQPTNQKMCYA